MAFLNELDVVNKCIGTLGESPLNSLSDEHPLMAAALQALKVASMRVQARVWWFNRELTTLVPDTINGSIFLPADTIRLDPTDTSLNYVQRGNRLYKPYAPPSEDKYRFTKSVQCWLVRNLPFTDLPPTAQTAVMFAAVLDFQKEYDSDTDASAALTKDLGDAMVQLNTDHIRNVNANVLNRPSLQRKLMTMAPTRAYRYS